ncbi:MAG: HD domain-containing protein [Gemmatimonadetes bacterium]|nr:HD domain-containing protein [Gemmatimonadota bacterium]
MSHHPIVEDAAGGRLPEWAEAGEDRRAHMTRVADLMGAWAASAGLGTGDVLRWRAAAHLHDVLRDADPETLRQRVPPALQALPGLMLHGPAAAERLRVAGVDDGELLSAVAYHTVGSPYFGGLGRALYAADFLDPGRSFLPEWRQALRARAPSELDDVVFEIVGSRIRHRVEQGGRILSLTLDFWNRMVEERS